MAWNIASSMQNVQERALSETEISSVPSAQCQLPVAAHTSLSAIAADVRVGLLETVGVESRLVEGECPSIELKLPSGTNTKLVARAIDMENVEAWCDERGRVHVAISPWYSTKEVDQTALSIIKVVHVMLGLHASDAQQSAQARPKGLIQRLLVSMMDIMLLQKRFGQGKNPHSK